jgi:uncharacterized surface protein with fasciclin (FAS1) repeats
MKKSKHTRCQLAIDRTRLWVLLPVLLLLFSACRDDSFFDRDPERAITVEERLRSNPDYSSFVTALDHTGLMQYINNSGLWTVFAPTNAAMAGVNLTPARDSQENIDLLLRLNYHIGLGLRYTSAIVDGERRITRMGKFFTLESEPAAVNGQEFGSLKPNQSANNGVIHEIDEFLMPAPNTARALQTEPNLSQFAAAVEYFRTEELDFRLSIDRNRDGIIDDSVFVDRYALGINLAAEGTLTTIFAPSDAAINAWLASQQLTSLFDLEDAALARFINRHIVAGVKPSATLTAGQILEGSDSKNKFEFQPAMVVQADIPASNGIIHMINRVL